MRTLSVLLLMIIFQTSAALAIPVSEMESLRGLQAIEVVIEEIPQDFLVAGVSKEEVRTSVELVLRSSGIEILEKLDLSRSPSAPYLYVQLLGFKSKSGAYVFTARVRLMQVVLLIHRDESRIFAATWDNIDGGLVGGGQLKSITGDIEVMVKRFANQFLTVNPR